MLLLQAVPGGTDPPEQVPTEYFWLPIVAPVTESRSPQMNRTELPASVSPSSGKRIVGGDACGPRRALRADHQVAPVEKVRSWRVSGTASAAGRGSVLVELGKPAGRVCGSEKTSLRPE